MNNLLKKYNSLDGKTATRKEIHELHRQLFDNLPLEIPQIKQAWNKLGNLLKQHSNAKEFDLTVKAIELPKQQLNAPRHKGLAKKGLSECGRLKKGYKYIKGGKIVKISSKKVVRKKKPVTKNKVVKKLLIEQFKPITKLTDKEIAQINKEYMSDILWLDEVDDYIKKVRSEKKRRERKKPAPKKQLALFGAKKKRTTTPKRKRVVKPKRKLVGAVRKRAPLSKGLGAPVPQITGLQSVANRTHSISQTYKISGDIATFLGNIEMKPKASVAVTLDAPQGAGKTRAFFQIINEFAKNYKVLFISAEEHPQSALFNNKLEQYVSAENQKNVYAIDETNFSVIKQYIPQFDVIFIDSWNKIAEKNNVDFDFDLRKGFDSKLFFAIFQRTQDGKMRGGSKAQFDGDIILKILKQDDFKDNFIIADKNRYQNNPIEELKYNIYHQNLTQTPLSNNEQITTQNEPIILEV